MAHWYHELGGNLGPTDHQGESPSATRRGVGRQVSVYALPCQFRSPMNEAATRRSASKFARVFYLVYLKYTMSFRFCWCSDTVFCTERFVAFCRVLTYDFLVFFLVSELSRWRLASHSGQASPSVRASHSAQAKPVAWATHENRTRCVNCDLSISRRALLAT